MSRRKNAPYRDEIVDDGTTIIYEGHDAPKTQALPYPKLVDQPGRSLRGTITQNGRFAGSAERFKSGASDAELVQVYEKIQSGIWVYTVFLIWSMPGAKTTGHGRSFDFDCK